MKKVYYGQEIVDDICIHLGIEITDHKIQDLLTLELFSDVYEKPNQNNTREEIDACIKEYVENCSIPLIDYSNYTDKEIIVLDETDINNIKVIDSLNYDVNEFNSLKQHDISEHTKTELSNLYNVNIVKKVFDNIKGRDTLTDICIIDFNFKTVVRFRRN